MIISKSILYESISDELLAGAGLTVFVDDLDVNVDACVGGGGGCGGL